MSRPRRPVDYAVIRRLSGFGLGSRRIARKTGVSRSVVQRILSGRRPEHGPARPCDACESRREHDADGAPAARRRDQEQRRHAHQLLAIGRPHDATDREFAAAKESLDLLLDGRHDGNAASLARRAINELKQAVDERRDNERRAEDARKERLRKATADLEKRWDMDILPIARRIEQLEFSERLNAEDALTQERDRALALLPRRLDELSPDARFETVVDRLVSEGTARAAKVLGEEPR